MDTYNKNIIKIIIRICSGKIVERPADMKAKIEDVIAIQGTICQIITSFFEKLYVLKLATRTIVARLVAMASRWVYGKIRLRSGTMIIPPPIPKLVEINPTIIPVKNIII